MRHRSGFGRTHLPCPCQAREQNCFSEFADSPGRGYCNACSKVVGPTRCNHAPYAPLRLAPLPPQRFVDADEVIDSCSRLIHAIAEYKSHDGYNIVRSLYNTLTAMGFNHHDAFLQSGHYHYAVRHVPALCEQLRRISSFAAEFAQLTLMPEVLSWLLVGTRNISEICYWVGGTDGLYRNAHIIDYDGLCRRKERHARFLYRSNQGYLTDQFFGAEQLRASWHTCTGQDFARDARIILVESPKSVLLGAAMEPHIIWLASMGTSGVTVRRAKTLRGRDVTILFDNDEAGREGAKKALLVLLREGVHARIGDPTKVFNGPQPDGWDVGDEAINFFRECYGF